MFLKARDEIKYLDDSVKEARKALNNGIAEFKAGRVDFNRVAVLCRAVRHREHFRRNAILHIKVRVGLESLFLHD